MTVGENATGQQAKIIKKLIGGFELLSSEPDNVNKLLECESWLDDVAGLADIGQARAIIQHAQNLACLEYKDSTVISDETVDIAVSA